MPVIQGFRPAWRSDIARFLPPAWVSDWLDSVLAGSTDHVRVSLEGDLPIGAAFTRIVEDEAELLMLAVAPSHRRQGQGRRLVEDACHYAAEKGALRIFLEVRTDNDAAYRLYLGEDFEEVGCRAGYYPDGCDARVMVRSLD